MKKTLLRVLTFVAMTALIICTLASCGSAIDTIAGNYEAAGYKTQTADKNTTAKIASGIVEELEISATVHVFTKDLNAAIVIEFDAKGDIDELLESDTIKGLIKDAQKSDIVRDNCLLIPISTNVMDLEAQISSMISIFKK